MRNLTPIAHLPAVLLLATAPIRAVAAPDALPAAAESGDVSAMVRLAFQYREGDGRAQDYAQAVRWFRQAAEHGNPRALDNLGWLTEQGKGTRKDGVRARELYRQAAELGNPEAEANLARCLNEGIGGPKDTSAALAWAIKAFESGEDDRGAAILMDTLLAQTNLLPHLALLEQAGRSHSQHAMLRLAHIYTEGLGGIGKDEAKAGIFFERARQYGMKGDVLVPAQLAELAARADRPGSFCYLPTTHIEQGWNMCAPTAAAMALGYYLGECPDPYAIKTNALGATQPGTGTAWDYLAIGVKTVTGHEWEFRSWPKSDEGFDAGLPVLLAELDAGRVVLIDLGPHTVVLAGYDAAARIVYIQNPAYPFPGVHSLTYDKLRETWHSPWHLSTTRGVPARPALLTGDSARRANRPKEPAP